MSDIEAIEAALRRSEQHLAAAQRITHCGSWELDLTNLGDINKNPLRWSDEVFRIFGYEPGEIEVNNENFFRAVHPDDRELISDAVQRALKTGTTYSIDHRVIRPDGSIRIVHEQSEIQYDDAGKMLRMIGTVQDVTELRSTEAQLVVADRMSAVGTLAAGVAHEINNPLTAVFANLELLSRALERLSSNTELPSAILSYVQSSREGAERVGAIVRDMMMLARTDDAKRTVEITAALDAALRITAHELRPRARVIREYIESPRVDANEARLAQVFVNVLRNSAQAIAEGDAATNFVRIRVTTSADRAVISIKDSGCGIPPDLRSRVFSPFFTLKPVGQGTGLGLAISQRIITSLGGDIRLGDDALPRGVEVVITLPLAAKPPAEPVVAAVASGAQRRGRRVLIVDDEPLVTRAMRNMLGDKHEVTVVNDPIAARDLVVLRMQTGEPPFDVILTDLMMPQMTGLDLHRELLELDPEQARRVVLMTGGATTPEQRDQMTEHGLRGLDKPFTLDALEALLAEPPA